MAILESAISTAGTSTGAPSGPTAASVTIQDLTFTARQTGPDGNKIRVEYDEVGEAGTPLSVQVNESTDIVVQLEINAGEANDGVSTADEVKTGIDNNAVASALVIVDVTGTGSNVLNSNEATNLVGGTGESIPATESSPEGRDTFETEGAPDPNTTNTESAPEGDRPKEFPLDNETGRPT